MTKGLNGWADFYDASRCPKKAVFLSYASEDAARDGIDRGWRADNFTDFLNSRTNTFNKVAECVQSVPRTFAGVCPQVPPCK